ncbi:hypothetical protein CHS0354_018729 [Potamilus streckersoni]|uniref:Uncharacterized protein n=1 Tax=Potamilus streckersoni TaxID=2493646 RepID=A0AAE0T305_9BIVA|nr:hypothetical protein CHS0354_018729 [Potamilus streckersoni]
MCAFIMPEATAKVETMANNKASEEDKVHDATSRGAYSHQVSPLSTCAISVRTTAIVRCTCCQAGISMQVAKPKHNTCNFREQTILIVLFYTLRENDMIEASLRTEANEFQEKIPRQPDHEEGFYELLRTDPSVFIYLRWRVIRWYDIRIHLCVTG